MHDRRYTIVRSIAAPISEVWNHWTELRHLQHWFAPVNFEILELSIDMMSGWRVRMRSPEGEEYSTHGLYQEVKREERLVMTQSWEGSDHQSEITVAFLTEDKGTRIIFEHRCFDSDASRDSHAQGWSEVIDHLERYIGY